MASGSVGGPGRECRVEADALRWYPTHMHRVRVLLTLAALVPMARAAYGQPVDPYKQPATARPAPAAPPPPAGPAAGPPAGPAAPPAPASGPAAPPPAAPDAPVDPYAAAPSAATQDPMLAERVAASLVARAQELLDTRVFLDAKQLAVESLVQSPRGASSDQARTIIHAVNLELGIPEDAPKPDPAIKDDVDPAPIQDPTAVAPPIGSPPEGRVSNRRIAASVHGGLYAGLLGATVGSLFSDDQPAKGAVPVGLAVGLAGALAMPRLADKLGWDERQIRTVGAASVWGGVIGGLLGDIADTQTTSAREVLIASSVGSTLAGLGGYAFSRTSTLTRGDIALVDTLAGIGAVGGLTLGMVMQPAQSEAYSLNSVFGIAGGVVVGVLLAPKLDATPRRMSRVAGLAAAGGAVPFLLYAAINDPGTNADERITGVLSTGGLVLGALLGFRLTRGMDEGLDTLDGKHASEPDDAPVALIGRSSAGRWGLGGVGLAPLSRALAPQHGMALQLVGATF
jgi:hypothetical protein